MELLKNVTFFIWAKIFMELMEVFTLFFDKKN